MPARLLLLGEAPGVVEDTYGDPFLGEAGQTLNEVITRSRVQSLFISNILACIPRGIGIQNFREPTRDEAQTCAPRILELIAIVQPKGLVLLGKVAKRFSPRVRGLKKLQLPHPSWINRLDESGECEYQIERCAEALRDFDQSLNKETNHESQRLR